MLPSGTFRKSTVDQDLLQLDFGLPGHPQSGHVETFVFTERALCLLSIHPEHTHTLVSQCLQDPTSIFKTFQDCISPRVLLQEPIYQPAFQLATTHAHELNTSVTSDLMSSQAWKTDRRATWSENRVPAKFLWTKLSRLPSLTKGSGKQDAAEMVHMASPTLEGSKDKQTSEPASTAGGVLAQGWGTPTGRCSPGSSSSPDAAR